MQKPEPKPYTVYTTTGTFHSDYDLPAQAEAAARAANTEAERLGIQTRYVDGEREAAR